jgi:hypothetical protein
MLPDHLGDAGWALAAAFNLNRDFVSDAQGIGRNVLRFQDTDSAAQA